MREIAEVAKIIRDSTNVVIEYNEAVESFTFDGIMVNEIEKSYFENILSYAVKQIDEILDYGNPQHIVYIEGICKKLQEKLVEIAEIKSDKLDDLDCEKNGWTTSLVIPKRKPKKDYLELWDKSIYGEDGKHEYILQIIGGFFDIEYDEVSSLGQEEINSVLIESHSVTEEDLQIVYSKAYLAYVLELYRDFVHSLYQKFQLLIDFIDEVSQFSENDTPQISTNKKGKLYYKGAKYELAFLFNFLYDYEYIIGSTRESDSIRYIKHFINESETYFFKAQEPTKVVGIDNDFGRIGNGEGHVGKEIKFTEKLMENLEKRLDELNNM